MFIISIVIDVFPTPAARRSLLLLLLLLQLRLESSLSRFTRAADSGAAAYLGKSIHPPARVCRGGSHLVLFLRLPA